MSIEFDIRYFLEHKALPKALYDSGAQLMASLMSDRGAAVREFYRKAELANPNYHCPYTEKDFSVDYLEFGRDAKHKDPVLIFRIRMPQPEASPLCRSVYLCYAKERPDVMYFTSELTPSGGYSICGWSRAGAHLNIEDASDKGLVRIAELFWELTKNA